jgi:hypothetical protein
MRGPGGMGAGGDGEQLPGAYESAARHSADSRTALDSSAKSVAVIESRTPS